MEDELDKDQGVGEGSSEPEREKFLDLASPLLYDMFWSRGNQDSILRPFLVAPVRKGLSGLRIDWDAGDPVNGVVPKDYVGRPATAKVSVIRPEAYHHTVTFTSTHELPTDLGGTRCSCWLSLDNINNWFNKTESVKGCNNCAGSGRVPVPLAEFFGA